jgi:uncharacterized protein (TIGR01319 family)
VKTDLPDIIVAEIGSTTTVVTAIGGLTGPKAQVMGQATHRTTVADGDVNLGLEAALAEVREQLGGVDLSRTRMLASSSAAGGLKMTVHGLVYDMTARAAREAALGAGAIVRHLTAGELTPADLDTVRAIEPNIVMLAGGVDYGEKDTVIANARAIARLGLNAPVIFAGNRAAAPEVDQCFREAGVEIHVVDNVYPRIDQLQVEPARRAIQAVFERHIVHAPGLGRVRQMVRGRILPTPGAVMKATELLHRVTGAGILAIDVGGATTDVHSVAEPSPEVARLLVSPEPLAKRTVEGDLGIVANAHHVAALLGEGERRALEERLGQELGGLLAAVAPYPRGPADTELAAALMEVAARVALERHVGRYVHYYGPTGRLTVAEGKDLSGVVLAVGTGGALSRLPGGKEVLDRLLRRPPGHELWPRGARAAIDRHYVMAAVGMLAEEFPEAAGGLLLTSLGEEGKVHGQTGHRSGSDNR